MARLRPNAGVSTLLGCPLACIRPREDCTASSVDNPREQSCDGRSSADGTGAGVLWVRSV